MARKSPKARRTRTTRHHAIDETLLQRNLPALVHSMTFAHMVEKNTAFAHAIKDLRWLFPPVCQRKDQAAMTETERSRYICAFNMINIGGTLGQLVDTHAEMHMQHSNARLLPWHRIFLYLFEEALHNYHPDVCVPYWDWTKPEEQQFPNWLIGILPTVQTPTRTINVIRSPGTGGSLASIAGATPTAMSKTTYDEFTNYQWYPRLSPHLGWRHDVRCVGLTSRSGILATPREPRSTLVGLVQWSGRKSSKPTANRQRRLTGSMDVYRARYSRHRLVGICLSLTPLSADVRFGSRDRGHTPPLR